MLLEPGWWKEGQEESATGYYRDCCNFCNFCTCCNFKEPRIMGKPY